MRNDLPSGQQIELRAGEQRLVVVEVGAGLRAYGARPMATTKLDNAYTDLARDAAGLARVELSRPDRATSISLWLDETYPYLQLFTGDSQPSVDRRSIAVEPMTCAPNAFRTGEGVLVLEPGASATSTWGIET